MRFVAVAVVAGVVVMAAGATTPSIQLTAAGNARAAAATLRLSDMGKGWKAAVAPAGGLQVACKGFQPNLKGVVEIGAGTSDGLRASIVGPFVSEVASVYATPSQASTVWSRVVTPGLITCIAQSVQSIAAHAKGLKVKILTQGALTIQKPTARVAAYRVTANLTAAKVKYARKLYFDVILVSKKSTVAEITFSEYQYVPPAVVESALAALVAHRST